jgi:polyribonucleotide 5'-hydroxyl-kinase
MASGHNRRHEKRDRAEDVSVTRTFTVTFGASLVVHFKDRGTVVLLEGGCEALGAKLQVHASYHFSNRGVTLTCTSQSMRVEVSGIFDARDVVTDTAVRELHAQLGASRVGAAAGNASGPVVVIAGQVDRGKSTLGATLINRALADGKPVAAVELDVGQAGMGCPGSLSATFLRSPMAPDDDFQSTVPLSFFFGDKTVTPDSAARYTELCGQLRRCLDNVNEREARYRHGGAIINTMGWTTGLGLELLQRVVDLFRATHVIVVGDDEPLLEAMRALGRGSVRALSVLPYVAPPDRLRRRSTALRIAARDERIRCYFVGTPQKPLAAIRVVLSVSDLIFLDAVTLAPLEPKLLKPTTLAAVSHGNTAELAKLSNIAGFVVLLDIGEQFVSVLTPSAGPLPSRVLLVSPSIRLSNLPPM